MEAFVRRNAWLVVGIAALRAASGCKRKAAEGGTAPEPTKPAEPTGPAAEDVGAALPPLEE